MAATFAELIEEKYRAVTAQASITDLSTVRGEDGAVDGTTGEDEARTTAMCEQVADEIIAVTGDPGATSQDAKSLAAHGAKLVGLTYSGVIPLVVSPEREAAVAAVWVRINALADALRQEASTPVVASCDEDEDCED